ncbi:MAG: hypothetical protein QW700_07935 [Desulfurococcaceae archaeon]|uniref:hypothetical protein n=1 Tax=Pyrobaculum sp. TaxID=2004705 RepID=UPI0031621088
MRRENLSGGGQLSPFGVELADALRCFGSHPELSCNRLSDGRGALSALAKALWVVARRVADIHLDMG